MKILMVNKYFFIKGGSERYFFELSEILEKNGHQVIPFAMKHANNFKSEYSDFFVDYIDFNLNSSFEKIINGFKFSNRIIYSFHAKRKIEELIRRTKPDIVHLHMIDHQLSPSILHTIKQYNIPILQTLHQYKLVCPNYRLYNMYTKKICKKCLDRHYYHPIFEKCHKDSSWAGVLIAFEMYIHKALKIYEKNVDLFHVPSRFMGKKLRQCGIGTNKIFHLFYTININDYLANYNSNNYFVYYGRLAEEKGILTLLKAMKLVKTMGLKIIGDGPQRTELEEFASKNKLMNISFLGYKGGKELKELIAKSKFVVVPSEWYDNSPLVIYESFSMGKPVIASDMGGIPELVDHEENGLQFEAGNTDELADQINCLINNPKKILELGQNARHKAETEFAPEIHYQKIMEKYEELLNGK